MWQASPDAPPIQAALAAAPARAAQLAAQNHALVALARGLAEPPSERLHAVAEAALSLLQAGSAGVWLLAADTQRVRWAAAAGAWQARTGETMPLQASPCGDVIDANAALLLRQPAARCPALRDCQPPAEECLLVPLHAGGRAVGALWAAHHDGRRRFDAEDLRLLQDLAPFAAAAVAVAAAQPPRSSVQDTIFHLVQNAPFGVYVVDAQFRMVQASAASLRTFAQVQPLLGRRFDEIVRQVWPEPFATQVLARFAHTLASGEPFIERDTTEWRKDSPERESYEWKIERILLPDGSFGVVCYFYDLTERQHAAEALRLRTAQFETLVNGAPMGIYLLDAGLRIRQVNPAALPAFGDIQNLIGRDLAEVLHILWPPERAEEIVRHFRHTLASGEPFEVPELSERRADLGTVAHYEWQIQRIPLPDGTQGVVCYFRDISSRLLALARIRASELRYRAFITASADVVYSMSPDWRQLLHLEGRDFIADAHEPKSDWLQDYIHPQDQPLVLATISAAIASTSIFELEHRVRRVDGELGWTHSRAVPMFDADGRIEEWFGTASDVTARRQAQEALAASEERYRNLFNAMDQGYCIVDMVFDAQGRAVDWLFLEVNPAFAKLTGVEDAVGRRMRDIAPEHEARWFEVYGQVAQSGQAVRFVSQAQSLDNRWFDLYALKVGGTDSRKVAVLFTNITERRRTEDALRASEQQFRATFEHAAIGIVHVGLDHRWLRVNPAMCRLTGYSAEALTAMRFTDITHPDDLHDNLEQLRRMLAGEIDSFAIEKRFIHHSGRHVWVAATAALLRDGAGQPLYLIGAVEDITDRKATLAQLDLQRRFVERLTHGMPSTLHVYSRAEQRNLWVNRHLGDTLGFSAQSIAQMGPGFLHQVLHVDDVVALDRHVQRVFDAADNEVLEFEYRVRDHQGRWRWLHQSDTVFSRDAQGRALEFVGTATDVTARKATEADLIAALVAAEDANQAKSDFLSRMSHELRSPLNAVLGFAQLLQTGTPPPTPLQQEGVSEILKAGWYLLGLIDEILDLALIESGRLSFVMEPLELAELLDDCLALVEGQAAQHGVTLHGPALGSGCHVQADRMRLKQVVVNLLGNAIKYNRPGGTVHLQGSAAAHGRMRISVVDSGQGLRPEQLQHLFRPFERLGQEAGVIEGKGIGLALCKRLVDGMGGAIGVRSSVGQGSEFWVELPPAVWPADEAAAATLVTAAPAPTASRHGPDRPCTVLYIEDNAANRMLVQQLLARRPGLRLLLAGDGPQGLAQAREQRPDVVLMDLHLPGIGGHQAMQQLAADPRTARIPVIAVSAHAMRPDVEKGLQAGFFRYLSKPIRIDSLTAALDDALAHAAATSHENGALSP